MRNNNHDAANNALADEQRIGGRDYHAMALIG
jgi:hypothetical protein